MAILVGDIGATNARLAIADQVSGRVVLSGRTTLPSQRFSSLVDAVEAFFEKHPEARRCRRACFGLAGLVRANRCAITNLPWTVDGASIERHLGLEHAHLLNDVEAAAWGLTVLEPDSVRTLQEGNSERLGNRALVAPGTGLGEAGLVWDGRRHVPFATEGGHTDFAADDDLQVALWRFLARRHGHVSWERVVSGPGLVDLFRFLLDYHGKSEPEWLPEEIENGDPAEAISRRARETGCPVIQQALDLFFALLGAEAGNLALKLLATGGVYLGGGIIPKLLPELAASRFLGCFEAKGRYRPVLRAVPIRVVVDDDLGLLGAAAHEATAEAHTPK